MVCCGGGYLEHRFQTSVDKNFFCLICQEVLKDPVQCHNEHYFCKACVTQHLKNSKKCPVCKEKVTEETLNKPTRIVTNYLNGLIINCDHNERGCTKLIELGRLEVHISVCDYRPESCPNEKCARIMNFADLGADYMGELSRLSELTRFAELTRFLLLFPITLLFQHYD